MERTVIDGNGCHIWMRGKDGHGYGAVNTEGKTWLATRLIWSLINGPIPEGMCVCHKCDVPACCNLEHLFLATKGGNSADRDSKGRTAHPTGEKHPMSRIRAEDVIAIRESRQRGVPVKEIASTFGLSRSHVREILIRKSWSHI